jgi:16S rRNA (uracil1498-N3)-methyltransferase
VANGRPAPLVTLHRFFLAPGSMTGGEVRFAEAQSRQLQRVLRLRIGDLVLALDGAGIEYEVILEKLGEQAVGRIVNRGENQAEPRIALDLYAGILKGNKFETVLQKGTEVGIASFVPLLTARSVPAEPSNQKMQRYQTIVREAAEQSRRGRIPLVAEPIPLREGLMAAIKVGPVLLLWEDEAELHLVTVPLSAMADRVAMFVGPEGGFTSEEAEFARTIGGRTVTMGPRILRAETAGVVGPALLLARLGALG